MIYPKYKTFQVLIPLLKAHNISHIVISPGSRMREFVIAVEEDSFFTTYNVTDERSASYFAIGISQELEVPVVIVCTSSTATTNYVPGVTEAYYQNVPILVLTGDRDPYMLGQQEDQMINQVGMYDRVVRKAVTLPIVKNDFDKWYAERLINEAILELDHHKKGPVHINVPVPAIPYWEKDSEITEYPLVKVINRYEINDKNEKKLEDLVNILCHKNRILVLGGQNTTSFDQKWLAEFYSIYNCIIHAEHMGNVNCEGVMNIAGISEGVRNDSWNEYLPDLVISFHGTFAISRNLKETIRRKPCEHWLIDEEGNVVDAYRNLTTVFECKPNEFFKYFVNKAPSGKNNNKEYYNLWKNAISFVNVPEFRFSNVYVIHNFLKVMPAHSNLHLSILNSIRLSQYVTLPEDTKTYANVGTDGIDGCMSTFFGQACSTERECFLVIGDLSFFYDMNSLRIKHNKSNCHILLINNHGGNEFYQQPIVPTTPQGLGASHSNSAKAWAESVGFKYITANDKENFESQLQLFITPKQESPILFEIFTDQIIDRESVFELRGAYSRVFDKNAAVKDAVKSLIGESSVKKIKSILGK